MGHGVACGHWLLGARCWVQRRPASVAWARDHVRISRPVWTADSGPSPGSAGQLPGQQAGVRLNAEGPTPFLVTRVALHRSTEQLHVFGATRGGGGRDKISLIQLKISKQGPGQVAQLIQCRPHRPGLRVPSPVRAQGTSKNPPTKA